MKLDSYLSPCKKVNSKWIKDLTVRPEILKPFEEKIGKTLENRGIGKVFFNRTLVTYEMRSTINK